jgi:hypothetical protein
MFLTRKGRKQCLGHAAQNRIGMADGGLIMKLVDSGRLSFICQSVQRSDRQIEMNRVERAVQVKCRLAPDIVDDRFPRLKRRDRRGLAVLPVFVAFKQLEVYRHLLCVPKTLSGLMM